MCCKLEAIDFLTKQQYYNKENIKILDTLGIDTEDLKSWDNLYSYIINILKEA